MTIGRDIMRSDTKRAMQITEINGTEGYIFSEHVEKLADTYLGEDAPEGEIYRVCAKEYGRCVSKIYVDKADEKQVPVGWVFQKRQQYDDSPKTFIRETWVVLGAYQPAVPESVIT